MEGGREGHRRVGGCKCIYVKRMYRTPLMKLDRVPAPQIRHICTRSLTSQHLWKNIWLMRLSS